MENKAVIRKNFRISIMLGSFAFGIMSFILPIYTKSIGSNALDIGGLFSMFSIITLVLRPIIGRGIDIYGRKRFFVTAFLFYGAAMLLFSFSVNLIFIYISRLVQAIGSSFMWISAYSIAADIADDEKRGIAMGQVDGASNQGSLYGSFIGFMILGNFTLVTGWNLMFKAYAALCIIAGFIAYKYIPETGAVKKEKTERVKDKLSVNFIKLLVIVFIGAISSSMLSPIMMIYLQDKFTTNIVILAYAFFPSALVYAFLPSRLGGISDRIGRITPMVIGLVGSGIVSIALGGISNLIILVMLWVLEALGAVMASPAEEAMVSDLVGKDTRGSSYGIYYLASSIGCVIGPLLGGWVYDSFGHTVPFYINGIILLIDAILVVILFRNYKKVYHSSEYKRIPE